MGHIVDFIDVPVYRASDDPKDVVTEKMPRIEIDISFSIIPPDGGEISLESVRGIIYQLRKLGFNIGLITMDTYQCLAGDTEIFVIGHGSMKIKDIAEKFKDKEFLVYSFDKNSGKFVFSRAKNARITRANASKVVRVYFDNERRYVDCTPDHLFMLNNGEWVQAKDLKAGDNLKSPFKKDKWIKKYVDNNVKSFFRDESSLPSLKLTNELVRCVLEVNRRKSRYSNTDIGSLNLDEMSLIDFELRTKSLLEDDRRFAEKLMISSTCASSASNGFFNRSFRSFEGRSFLIDRSHGIIDAELSLMSPDDDVKDLVRNALFGVRGDSSIGCFEDNFNCVVSKVVRNQKNQDMYDIEVPAHENFMLSNGIIVHNSKDALQILESKGFVTDSLSVDTTADPYECLKRGIMERRVRVGKSELLDNELLNLEKDAQSGKIDHTPTSSKDLSDAVCGVVFSLTEHRPTDLVGHLMSNNEAVKKIKDSDDDWLIKSENKKVDSHDKSGKIFY